MENNGNNFSSFCSEVLTGCSYEFTSDLLREFYDEGYTVEETLDWAYREEFGNDLLGDL